MKKKFQILLAMMAFTLHGVKAMTVSDIATMFREEALAEPACSVTGVVSCVMAWQVNSFSLVDETNLDGPGVYVGGKVFARAARLEGAAELTAGDLVVVEGRVIPFMLEPGIVAETIRIVGRRRLGPPPERRLADLNSGRFNNRRVCVRGVLRSARTQTVDIGSVTSLSVGTPDGVVLVRLRGAWPDLANSRDAEIAVSGVCVPSFNSRAEFLRVEVEAFSRESIQISPVSSSTPVVLGEKGRASGVMAWTPDGNDGHLRCLRGEVLYVNVRERFFVLNAGTPVRVNVEENILPSIGDYVEANGFPELSKNCGVLDEGRFTSLDRMAEPCVPQSVSKDEIRLLTQGGAPGERDYHYNLVRVSGRVVSVSELSHDVTEIDIDVCGCRLKAQLEGEDFALAHRLQDRPLVTVIGVLELHFDEDRSLGRGLSMQGVTVLVRDAADVIPVFDAESRGRRLARLGTIVGLCLLLPLAGLAVWLWIRSTRQRTLAKAIAQDRRRLAEELHDTIAQHLSGARLLLFSAQAESSALSQAAQNALTMAGDILESARREMRDAILNLQSDEQMMRPLGDLLRMAAAKANVASGARVRTMLRGIPDEASSQLKTDLLAIVQEAISNAVKHGKAKRVVIVSDPLPPKGFSMSVLNDGALFDAENALGPETGHFGLSSMRERAARNGFSLVFGARKGWMEIRLERRRG